MKALSIQQPWAWPIVNGYQPLEYRTWNTRFRGEILIHAGKKFDRDGYDQVREEFPEIPMPAPADFELAALQAMLSWAKS